MAIASLSGNTLSTGDGLIIRGGASGSDVAIIGTCKSENFGFITNDTLRATFDSSGNLGIGTNEPSAVLDVRGAISTNTSIASPIVSGTTCIASPVICMTGTFSLPSSDGSSGQVMCTDGSGGLTWGQGGHVIALGGTAQTQRKCLNFAGLAVCASDNSSGNATNICVKSTGVCLPVIQDDGTQIYTCFTSAVIGDCLQGDATPKLGGNLDVNGNCLKSASDGNIVLCPDGSGVVKISSNCFPGSDGSSGQLICTNGSGALQWVTVTGATPGGNNNEIQYNNSGSFGASSNLSYDGSTLAVTGAQTLSGNFTVGTKSLHVNTSTNKVGIGTTSPGDYDTDDLVIQAQSGSQGGITIASDTNQAGRIYFADGTSGGSDARGMISYDHNNDKLSVGTAGSNRIYVHSDGHIALGGDTASVPGKVVVEGTSTTINNGRVLFTVFDDSNMASGVGGGVGFFGRHTNGSFTSFASVNAAKSNATDENTDGDLVISTRQNSTNTLTEKMRIGSSGNVGIGTTTPANLLEIYGTGNIARLHGSSGTEASMLFTPATNSAWQLGAGVSDTCTFQIYANSPNKSRLTLMEVGGSMGVGDNSAYSGGTALPNGAPPVDSTNATILKVDGGVGVDAALQVSGHNDSHGLDIWTDVSTGDVYFDQRGDHANYDMQFRTRTTGTPVDAMIISGAGDVSIGDGAPTYRLDVYNNVDGRVTEITNEHASGDILALTYRNVSPDDNTEWFLQASDSTAMRTRIWSDGDVETHDQGTLTSDERLKTNIVDATSKLADIMRLKVRNFEWRPEYHPSKVGEKKIGFIAQEVEEVFPSLINESDIAPQTADEPTMRKTIKNAFTPILVKALQEVTVRLEAAEAEIAALKG